MSFIKISNASVSFTIYNAKTRLLRNEVLKAVGGKIASVDQNTYITALDNINLEINEGEKVALVGHNGAGKSTLLKLIVGTYVPQKGQVETQGSISALTDITMGMDQDSTGYENIIMRLIYMGLTYKEAKEKSAEIIAFSELDEFINFPVRIYSTGMFLRLAYSIVTSIIPEILIMDEMIGAGDANFIQKAKNRSLTIMEQTKIMIFSSHDTNILAELCSRGVWLKNGRIHMDGPIKDIIKEYSLNH